jgi:hypothetical protein
MISLPTAFIKHPCVDGLQYGCYNDISLACQLVYLIWIYVRLCNESYILCLDLYDKCLKEALLVSLTDFQQLLVSHR